VSSQPIHIGSSKPTFFKEPRSHATNLGGIFIVVNEKMGPFPFSAIIARYPLYGGDIA
jgi:hypothetical protein